TRAAAPLVGDLAERVVAHLGAELHRLVAETRRLVDRHALAAAQGIADFVEDRPNRFDDLIARGRDARRGAPTGVFAETPQFLLDGTQLPANRVSVGAH